MTNKIKRFVVNQLEYIPTLFGYDTKWRKVSSLCYSYKEAIMNMELLQRNDKFSGAINNYRVSTFYL